MTQGFVITGLDGSWGGRPDVKATMRVQPYAGDGDALRIVITTDGHEDEPSVEASILVHHREGPKLIAGIDEQAAATRNATTIEGFGTDRILRQVTVERERPDSPLTWLAISWRDSEDAEHRLAIGFSQRSVAAACDELEAAINLARDDDNIDRERRVQADQGDHVLTVTVGWLAVVLSWKESRRVGVGVGLMTEDGSAFSTLAWLPFADAERLIAKLRAAAPAHDPA